ncbi:MAG: carbohydrate kinase [Halolamina sp.]
MHEVLVAGELIIDFHPDSTGSLAAVDGFSKRPGGAPANVAVGLARLGRTPAFWTRVGDDPFGDFLVDVVTGEGIPETYVRRDDRAKTGLAFVSHGDDADREFELYLDDAASTRLGSEAIPEDALAAAEWVHVGGVELSSEPARSATFDLAERAGEAGATVSFDPNARPELWTDFDYADTLDRMLGLADVVKASAEDLSQAGVDGDEPAGLAEAVRSRGPHTVLLTRGDAGAHAVASADAPWGPATVDHDGHAVDAVDTTGAGDAFTAGAIASFVDGGSLAEAVADASAVAALTTTAEGAMTALPTKTELAAFRET